MLSSPDMTWGPQREVRVVFGNLRILLLWSMYYKSNGTGFWLQNERMIEELVYAKTIAHKVNLMQCAQRKNDNSMISTQGTITICFTCSPSQRPDDGPRSSVSDSDFILRSNSDVLSGHFVGLQLDFVCIDPMNPEQRPRSLATTNVHVVVV